MHFKRETVLYFGSVHAPIANCYELVIQAEEMEQAGAHSKSTWKRELQKVLEGRSTKISLNPEQLLLPKKSVKTLRLA